MVTRFTDDGTAVTASWDDAELFRYTYRPSDPRLESPRPYFHPVRTLRGDPVSLYRPHDHVWHKGIAWSLPNVGPENFWGGPTYRRGDAYIQLPNNGTMRHESFAPAKDGLKEHLTWTTESGHTPIAERHAAGPPGPQTPPPASAFPGATAVTVLDVYDWPTQDGLRGGSAHVHLASTEGYMVLTGSGQLQTLTQHGYAETPLRPGDCLWFTPGTIHRLVNHGDLRIMAVMQNAGLPEDGDAVLTFPPDVLADPDAYRRAASLDSTGTGTGTGTGTSAGTGRAVPPDVAARRRRDLAITGYLALRDQGPAAVGDFLAAAVKLVAARTDAWRDRWRTGALATAEQTGAHLDGIAAGAPAHLAGAALWRIDRPAGEPAYGMCGRLTTYPSAQAVRAG